MKVAKTPAGFPPARMGEKTRVLSAIPADPGTERTGELLRLVIMNERPAKGKGYLEKNDIFLASGSGHSPLLPKEEPSIMMFGGV
jgi:hypothetical protein